MISRIIRCHRYPLKNHHHRSPFAWDAMLPATVETTPSVVHCCGNRCRGDDPENCDDGPQLIEQTSGPTGPPSNLVWDIHEDWFCVKTTKQMQTLSCVDPSSIHCGDPYSHVSMLGFENCCPTLVHHQVRHPVDGR